MTALPTAALPHEPDDDDCLVAATIDGDLNAWAQLYERHSSLAYGVARRILGDDADADDVLQEVFLGIRPALRTYEARGTFRGWLRKRTARIALMELRSRKRRVRRLLWLSPPPTPPVDGCLDRLVVHKALDGLPDGLRAVWVLREVEGYSHGEIGRLLGISESASGVRHHRAWKRLRKALGRDG